MRLAFVIALIATAAVAQSRVYDRACDLSSRRSTRGGVSCGPSAFALTNEFNFQQTPALPTCSSAESCVFTWRAKTDGSAGHVLDSSGAELSGYTEGVGAVLTPSYIPGVYSWLGIDDSSSSSHIPSIASATVRGAFSGDWTVVVTGYSTVQVNANGGWYFMLNDGTNGVQLRHASGNLECLDQKSGLKSSATLPLNGWSQFSCRRSGNTLTARAVGVDGSGITATSTAITSGTATFWGGTGGCCTPGGSGAGQAMAVTVYSVAKSTAWLDAADKAVFGAPQMQSGPSGAIGTVGTTPIGRDDVPDSGVVQIFVQGAYITDPLMGVRSQRASTNSWAADPLAAATWTDVATPTVTSNASAGPLFRWKNTNECDLIVDDNAAAFEGKRSGSAGSTNGFYRADCYLKAGTSGTTTTKARIHWTTDGAIDAGLADCDFTGLSSTAARYGCSLFTAGDTGGVKADLLVGNAAAETGSVTVCQCQLTKSMFPESPTVDGTAKSDNWIELAANTVPYGVGSKGKIEEVFAVGYSTSMFGADTTGKSTGSYLFDAYNTGGGSHDILVWLSTSPTQSDVEGLMYGPNGDIGDGDNRFLIAPVQVAAWQFYVVSYEWRPSGSGCRGLMRFDSCADPSTCHASTMIASNASGAVGECADQPNVVVMGTRGAPAGSDVSSVWFQRLRVYR